MQERRNSDRLSLLHIFVKEENGDYLFNYKALNLSDDGIFLEGKIRTSDQEPFSKLTFTLPNGVILKNIIVRMIREERKGPHRGAAYEFMNMDEATRMELKKFLFEGTLRGSA